MTRNLPLSPDARKLPAQNYEVTRFLQSAEKEVNPAAGAIMEALTKYCSRLCWRQSYDEEDFGSAFLANYGFLEVLGIRGHFRHDKLALGILILGPDIEYPAHFHTAEELYVPLSGTAKWSKDGQRFVTRQPGTVIHHPSEVIHAMKIDREPLITAYVWIGGDLTGDSGGESFEIHSAI